MNNLQRLLVLTVCVTGFSYAPVIDPIARAQSEQTVEMSSEQTLNRAKQLDQQADELSYQGRYAEAILLRQESLSIREEVLGSNHLDVAMSLEKLARLNEVQGNYEAALPLCNRILSILKDHLDMTASFNEFAQMYGVQDDYAAAFFPLCNRILSISEESLGPNHLDDPKG